MPETGFLLRETPYLEIEKTRLKRKSSIMKHKLLSLSTEIASIVEMHKE